MGDGGEGEGGRDLWSFRMFWIFLDGLGADLSMFRLARLLLKIAALLDPLDAEAE